MYLGIEIGGTKLQLGLGAGDGQLGLFVRRAVQPAAGAAGILAQLEAEIPALLAAAQKKPSDLRAMGVGFGGPVDDATRRIIKSHQVAGWDDFALPTWLEERFQIPVALGNDADVAGLAEALHGAGRGRSPIFYMTIGSGIGGALIENGRIYRGSGRGAVEVGHLRGWRPGEPGQPKDWRILEEVASGWSIERRARSLARNHSHLFVRTPDADRLTVKDVGDAAEAGLDWAQQLLLETWTELAEALCQVIVLLAPRRLILGGGVALLGETYLFKPLRQLVAERVFRPFAGSCEIVPAELGEAVVVHGALALARQLQPAN